MNFHDDALAKTDYFANEMWSSPWAITAFKRMTMAELEPYCKFALDEFYKKARTGAKRNKARADFKWFLEAWLTLAHYSRGPRRPPDSVRRH